MVKAALAHLTTPPAMAAPAPVPLRRAASAPAPASPAASKQPRSHNRSVMQAPATLLTQAAAILANYMRAQPSLRDAEAAAGMAESYDFHPASTASAGANGGAAGGEGGEGEGDGGGAGSDSLLSNLPQGWEFEPQAALQLVCEAVPGACSHVEPLQTAPPRPRSGPTVSASQATAPLSVAPSIAAAPPQQLLLVQSLAAATACLSRGVERGGGGGGKRAGHAVSPAAAQAALLFADHVPLTCWTARGSGSGDAPRPEASAAGAACVSACWALLACGHVHPELDGLLDKLLPSIAALVRQGTAAGRKGRAPPDPWPVLLLAAQMCRSRRVAARLLAHTPTGEALVAEQLRRGGGDGEGGLLLQLLLELRYVDRYKLLNPLKLPKCEPPRTVESLVGKPAQRAFGAAPEGQQFMSMADLAPELAAMMAADLDRDKPFRSAATSNPPDAAMAEGEASVGGQGGGDGGEGGSSGVGGGGDGGVGGSDAGSAAMSAEASRVLRPESTQGSVVSASGQQQVPGSAGGDGHGLPGLTATANSSKLGTPAAGVSPEASSLLAAQASQGRLQTSTSAGVHGVLGAAAGQPASGGVSGAASMASLGGQASQGLASLQSQRSIGSAGSAVQVGREASGGSAVQMAREASAASDGGGMQGVRGSGAAAASAQGVEQQKAAAEEEEGVVEEEMVEEEVIEEEEYADDTEAVPEAEAGSEDEAVAVAQLQGNFGRKASEAASLGTVGTDASSLFSLEPSQPSVVGERSAASSSRMGMPRSWYS